MKQKRRVKKKGHAGLLGLLILIIAFAGIAYLVFSVPASPPENSATITRARVGDVAENFRLPTADGSYVSLSDYRGSLVLVFFSEGIGCDPCWRQIVELQDSAELSEMKVKLIAVTVDPVDKLQPIVKQWGIRVPLASDTSMKTAKAYDTLNLGSMHPGQKPGHTFILVGADGIIKWRYDLPQSEANAGMMYVPTRQVIDSVREVLLGS